MARQRKAFPAKVSNRAAQGRKRVEQLRKEEKERKRQRKAFEALKRGGN